MALWPLAARINFPPGVHSPNNVNVISDSYSLVLLLFIKRMIGESDRKREMEQQWILGNKGERKWRKAYRTLKLHQFSKKRRNQMKSFV
jgi:hypothetical protein